MMVRRCRSRKCMRHCAELHRAALPKSSHCIQAREDGSQAAAASERRPTSLRGGCMGKQCTWGTTKRLMKAGRGRRGTPNCRSKTACV